jgi:hypothetical protein
MSTATNSSRAVYSDQEIEQISSGTSIGIAKWVRATAAERKISVRRRRPLANFARAVSRLSDAEVDLDQVEELLMALRRSRVITPFQRGLLQVHYLR